MNMQDQLPLEFPLSFTILCYITVALLALMLIVLIQISVTISSASQQRKKQGALNGRTVSSEDFLEETETPSIEVGPGTPFEEFLNEDPQHRTLPKKDQFKSYRKWRAEKGLNWSK